MESLIFKIVDNRIQQSYDFTDQEIRNCVKIPLRDYQISAVQTFLQEQAMIMKAATGSGKTKVLAAVIKLLDIPTLVLMHKIDLIYQTQKKFKEDGLTNIGIVQGNNVKTDKITLSTIQSAHKINNLQQFKFVTVDEVHKASAPTYQNLLRQLDTRLKLGLSGTPFSKDKLHNALVKAWIGDIKFDLSAKELIAQGFLAEPTIHMISIDKVTQTRKLKNGTKIYTRDIENYGWVGAERGGIIHNTYRNQKIAELAMSSPAPVLVLVKNIKHGEKLNKMIANSVFIYGDTSIEDRTNYIKQFEEGRDIILIGSTILDEGIDIVSLKTLIVCAGGKSFIRTLQRLGRALRRTKTKHKVLIYDFADTTNHYLERHSKERIKAYRKEGFDNIITYQ